MFSLIEATEEQARIWGSEFDWAGLFPIYQSSCEWAGEVEDYEEYGDPTPEEDLYSYWDYEENDWRAYLRELNAECTTWLWDSKCKRQDRRARTGGTGADRADERAGDCVIGEIR